MLSSETDHWLGKQWSVCRPTANIKIIVHKYDYTRHLSSCFFVGYTLTHPGHIVIYAPGDSLPCRRDAS
ncbi:hypothetical protein Ppb6_02824 [Photorhabdus australis subsp. thailandensis]|uniref:Uncharacterized protein n=1 Tax=Photorhabdus australis subsp. thailandensis TaxID=2805096 RepID=A0A1C0U252_9GAMM|nr:hypothetical protein Ppb6_02824 [Photorhabdus australis subsp. thailandensis]